MKMSAFVMAAGMVFTGAQLHAAVLIDQNFDNATFPLGTTVNNVAGVGSNANTGGNWVSNNSDLSGLPTVVADPVDGTNQVMQVKRIGGGATALYGSRDAGSAITSGVFSYEVSVYRPTGAGYILSAHNLSALPASETVPVGIYVDQDGVLRHRSTNGTAWSLTGASIAANAWTTIEAVANINAATWSIYVNGAAVLTDATFAAGDLAGVNAIGFLPQPPDGSVFYIDNVRLEAVPEPTALGMLGLGAAGLLARRRK